MLTTDHLPPSTQVAGLADRNDSKMLDICFAVAEQLRETTIISMD